MLNHLIKRLSGAGIEPTLEQIADALWLATHLPATSNQGVSGTETADGEDKSGRSSPGRKRIDPTEESFKQGTDEQSLTESKLGVNVFPAVQDGPKRMEKGVSARSLRTAGAPALPGKLELNKAVRPLKRAINSRMHSEIDVMATVTRISDEKYWLPILRPQRERWLDLVLVVDEWSSMNIWHRVITEFQHLLEQSGVFRNVQTWGFITEIRKNQDKVTNKSFLHFHAGWGYNNTQNRRRDARELNTTSGRRLIMLVSDCISPAWYDNAIASILHDWGRYGPIAILQVLPEKLWNRTALGDAECVKVRYPLPGVANSVLDYRREDLVLDTKPQRVLPVPIISFEPQLFNTWAKAVAGKSSIWIPGYLFPLSSSVLHEDLEAVYQENSPNQPISSLVADFQASASQTAQKLAGYLSIMPLTLPIMSLVQHVMLPDSRQEHLAEVFLSGLIDRPEPSQVQGIHPDKVTYDFVYNSRQLLQRTILQSDTIAALTKVKVSSFVNRHTGKTVDFEALIADPSSVENIIIDETNRSFAQIAIDVLKGMGGEFSEFAATLINQLEEGSRKSGEPQQNAPIKVLFIAANPRNVTQLRLHDELDAIRSSLTDNKTSTPFEVYSHFSSQPSNINNLLIQHRPDILHFATNASDTGEIILEDENSDAIPITIQELSTLLAKAKEYIRCVVVNTQSTELHIDSLIKHIEHAIGHISREVTDDAAIIFAKTFYRALSYGFPLQIAFDLAGTQIALLRNEELNSLLRSRVDPSVYYFSRSVKQVDSPGHQSRTRLLIIGSNPLDTEKIRLNDEFRRIQQSLIESKYRDQFEVYYHMSVRVDDLLELLMQYQPHILHFSGHATGSGEILLHNENDTAFPVQPKILQRVLRLPIHSLRCVILNANYTADLAAEIAKYLECAIGIPAEINDNVYIEFSAAFYQALAYGKNVKIAYELGCAQIQLENLPIENLPQLFSSGNADKIMFVNVSTTHSEMPYGTMSLDSQFYIEREVDRVCLEQLAQASPTVIYLNAPNQFGKSSLMRRVLHNVSEDSDIRYAYIDFQQFDDNLLLRQADFLMVFAQQIRTKLNITDTTHESSSEDFSSLVQFSQFISRHVLSMIESRIILA